jgi:protein-tyrosine phosphatase
VLFVCTANECRSPFAEALARQQAAALPIAFESAGLDAWRRPTPDTGRLHARERGLDLDRHVSRTVPWDGLRAYDVLLPMTRSHARELLAADATVRPRLFTVKQFARWLSDHPRPRRAAVGPWLDVVAADRPGGELIGESAADDVADPVGRPIEEWRVMSAELDAAISTILTGLFPSR